MDRIYRQGLCNIAGSLATKPGEGLFWERNPDLGRQITVTWSWSDQEVDSLIYTDLLPILINHSPLNKRGWVLQERLLSPRTMHFSEYPIWECRELVSFESGHISSSSPKTHLTTRAKNSLRSWYGILATYSRTHLTRETDRLIALSGIARMLSSLTGFEYFAGLWKEDLAGGLLWHAAKWIGAGTMGTTRSDRYIGRNIPAYTCQL